MKILPQPKQMIIAYAIAFVLNFGGLLQVDGLPKLIGFLFIDNLIYAVIVLIVIRIIMWLGKKMGMMK